MRILWITNIVFPEAVELLTHTVSKKVTGGGWMLGAASQLANMSGIELAIASVYSDVKQLTCLKGKRMTHFLLPLGKGNTHYNRDYEICWSQIKKEFNPDIIHIHGTEFTHGLAYVNACGADNVVVSIQGLLSSYNNYYYGGISAVKLLFNVTLRDIFKRNNSLTGKWSFKKRSRDEINLLKSVNHVIGRTTWDRTNVWAINPLAKYHFCNETLREPFYEGRWDYAECNKHTIFLSQADYPIKGLHQMLKALPIILKEYPDTKIRVAGSDITHEGDLFERLKISDYGKFIKKTIKKLELTESVHFTGPLSAEEMKKEYCDANVFVCPSSIENSPNSLGEAQLLGCPVVASYVGGIPDMMKGDENNMYRYEEVNMLAWKICHVFANKDKQTDMREEARLRHNPLLNSQQLFNIYQEVVSK